MTNHKPSPKHIETLTHPDAVRLHRPGAEYRALPDGFADKVKALFNNMAQSYIE